MRKLQFRDVFTMSRIITKANIKAELERIVTDNSENENKLSLGIDFVLGIMIGMSDERTEKEIYKFLASVLECEEKDIEESDPLILFDRLAKDDGSEQWADFFTKVWKLLQKKT